MPVCSWLWTINPEAYDAGAPNAGISLNFAALWLAYELEAKGCVALSECASTCRSFPAFR